MKNKSTQELFGATSEGLSEKSSYATPTVKVVTFQVEHGFAGTVDPSFTVSNVETFGSIDNEHPERGWTANDYTQTGEHSVFGNN